MLPVQLWVFVYKYTIIIVLYLSDKVSKILLSSVKYIIKLHDQRLVSSSGTIKSPYHGWMKDHQCKKNVSAKRDVETVFVQCCRRWANIKPTLAQPFVFVRMLLGVSALSFFSHYAWSRMTDMDIWYTSVCVHYGFFNWKNLSVTFLLQLSELAVSNNNFIWCNLGGYNHKYQ